MQQWQYAMRFVRFWWKAGNRHGLHSPFVYHLYESVICDKSADEALQAIAQLRQSLLRNTTLLNITDLGAGSSINTARQRTVADLAKHSAKSPRLGILLFRLVQHFQPDTIVELGTSLGLSALYMGLARPSAQLWTLEGCPETAAQAQKNIQSLNLSSAQVRVGPFDDTLPDLLQGLTQVDFCFVDGNHQEEPTVRYFEWLLPKCHANSVLVFDDIHWSSGMEQAWERIKEHPRVTVTVDLFFVGLVFLKEDQAKEHFQLRL